MRRKPFRYRVPDIAVMDRELVRREASEARDPYCRIVPALVIEGWSPSNRKGSLNDLLANYAEFGVPETIVFYPEQRLCQSYSGIECTQSVAGGAFHPLSMPEVKIDLDEIWK